MSYVIVKGIKYTPKKNELNLRSKKITSIDKIEGLNNLTNLIKLDLSTNFITEIKGLENLKNLNFLFLSKNNITEIKGLDSLTKLMVLHLDRNQITEIKGLENLRQLNSLHLGYNNITEVKGIEHLRNLKRLDLGPKRVKLPREKVREIKRSGISLKDQWAQRRKVKIIWYLIGALIIDFFFSGIIMLLIINYYTPPSFIFGVGIFFLLIAILYFPCLLLEIIMPQY